MCKRGLSSHWVAEWCKLLDRLAPSPSTHAGKLKPIPSHSSGLARGSKKNPAHLSSFSEVSESVRAGSLGLALLHQRSLGKTFERHLLEGARKPSATSVAGS